MSRKKRLYIKKVEDKAGDPTVANVHMSDGSVETLTGIGEPVHASTIKLGKGTLEDFINGVVAAAKGRGELAQELTVSRVLMDHPTDPTALIVTMSDDTVITINIARPSH